MKGAIIRLLEEYPSCSNGLSRTAQQSLAIISQGEKRPGKVFGLYQETEDRRFLGDSSFWVILHELLEANPPLLKLPEGKELTLPANPDQELTITPMGDEVLSGKSDWLNIVDGRIKENQIEFKTKTMEYSPDWDNHQRKMATHHYRGRVLGNEIEFVLETYGGYSSDSAIKFTAKKKPVK